MLLYDKHDLWRAGLTDGSLTRLTDGAEQNREYRVVNLDPEATFFSTASFERGDDIWLAVRDLWTKESA